MSQQLINLSPDLKRLKDEGYEVEIQGAFLVINNVPYVNSNKVVCRGRLVSDLNLAGNITVRPQSHVVSFCGDFPCKKDGSPIESIRHQTANQTLAEGLNINHSFSNKPPAGYVDYHEKMTRYIQILSDQARAIDIHATAQTYKVIETPNEDTVFMYEDTNSSRANIQHLSNKFRSQKIGIIGLGGTGAYGLDMISKTPVAEIHLFDGDDFLSHNAFRAPGAAPITKLREKVKKTDYFKTVYSEMHKKIFSHPEYITEANIHLLNDLDFVFICIDKGEIKKKIFEHLEKAGVTFIDTGIGINTLENALLGTIRVTTSTNGHRDHIPKRVSFSDSADGIYSSNIQVADLNALNATLAVMKWKKLSGFYQDLEKEFHSTYDINVNMLLSEENET